MKKPIKNNASKSNKMVALNVNELDAIKGGMQYRAKRAEVPAN
jgi:hypothetical protein